MDSSRGAQPSSIHQPGFNRVLTRCWAGIFLRRNYIRAACSSRFQFLPPSGSLHLIDFTTLMDLHILPSACSEITETLKVQVHSIFNPQPVHCITTDYDSGIPSFFRNGPPIKSQQTNQTTRGRSTSRDPASRIPRPPSVTRSRAPSAPVPPLSTFSSQLQNRSRTPSISGTLSSTRSRPASRTRAPSTSDSSLSAPNLQFGSQSQGQAHLPSRKPSDSNLNNPQPPKFEVAKKVSPGWFCVGVNPGNKDFTTGKVLSVHFWKRDDSEKMGGVAWKIKHNTVAATTTTRNLLLVPQPSHTPLGVSASGTMLALLVLSRNHVPFGTPGKAKILQEQKDVIEQALRTAIEMTNAEGLPVAEQWLFFLRRALLLLVKGRAIQTHDIEGIYNLEPLYKEIEVLIDNLETKGNHLQYAENSW